MRNWSSLAALALTAAALAGCRRNPDVAKRAYYDAGVTHFIRAQYPEAIIEFRNAVQIDPNFGQARYKLAQAYAHNEDAPAALRESLRAADLLPDDTGAQLMAGRFLLLARQFEDAKAHAQRVLDRNRRDVEAQILLGNALAGMRDLDGAMAEMRVALELDPSRVSAYTMLGQMQRAQGDVKSAEATFRSALATAPRSVNAHLALGNFLWSTRRTADAEAAFKDALALDAKDPLVNHALAMLYATTGRLHDAEPFFVAMAADARNPSARLRLADYYVATARIDDAVKVLDGIAAGAVTASDAAIRLAAIDYARGRKDAAYRRIDGLLARRPTDAEAQIVKARFLLLDNKLDAALAAANGSIASNPQAPGALYTLGSIQAERRAYDEASDAFTQVLKLRPGDAAARLQLAHIALLVGAADRSARLAADAKARAPRDMTPRLLLIRALIAKHDFDAADQELRPLLAAAPDSPAIQTLRGSLLAVEKNETAARAAFTRALELDPDSIEAFGGLVALDLEAGRVSLVRNEIEGRLARTPDNPDLLMMAARTYDVSGDRVREEQALRRVIEMAPLNLTAYSRLARLYVVEKRLDEARAQFETVSASFPKSIGAQTMVAMILDVQGKTDEAEKRYESVLAFNPRAAVAANNLAWRIVEKGGNLDLALQLAQTAKAEIPDVAEVNDTLGWIYFRKGLFDQAVRSLGDAVRTDPESAIYAFHLGLAHAQRRDKTKAAEALARAIRLKLPNAEAVEAARALATLAPAADRADTLQRD